MISIEDRKFYEHHGVDWAGTTRALFKNVDAGGVTQGGSTITQQLVKNTFSVNRKRDLTTKAREAVLAIELEKQLTKSQILEDYLNLVYFGNGAYGVQAAVERYFPGTPLANLNLAAGRAARRPHPVARGAEPDQAPRRRGAPAQRGARRDGGEREDRTPPWRTAAKSVPLPTHGQLPALRARSTTTWTRSRTSCSTTTRTCRATRPRCSARPSRRGRTRSTAAA